MTEIVVRVDVQYDSAQFSDAIFAGMGTDLTAEDVRLVRPSDSGRPRRSRTLGRRAW